MPFAALSFRGRQLYSMSDLLLAMRTEKTWSETLMASNRQQIGKRIFKKYEDSYRWNTWRTRKVQWL